MGYQDGIMIFFHFITLGYVRNKKSPAQQLREIGYIYRSTVSDLHLCR